MFTFWTSILFLMFALPISLCIMGLIGYAEIKNLDKRDKKKK